MRYLITRCSSPLDMSLYDTDPVIKSKPIHDDYDVRWSYNLGTGVSGPVRMCVSRSTGQKYALKILLDRRDKNGKNKAETEAILQWRCSGSDYVVRIIDIYRNELKIPGETYSRPRILLVLELMEGGELFEFISKRHHFSEQEASQYIQQIALALRYCHRLNIAHRDLKPENLLLLKRTQDPTQVHIKLSDFGFAKVDNGDLKTPQFTPYYVAPQVLEAQKRQKESQLEHKKWTPYYYDKSCDMWSLGVVLYIMLCGYPPFYSEVPNQPLSERMKRKIMSADFSFPENEWKDITSEAKDLIAKLICVEPSERLLIDEVLNHPWVNHNQSPQRDLPSPFMISDKETLRQYQETHAEFLRKFRMDDSNFLLKPVSDAKNPMLENRKQQHQDEGKPSLRSIKELRDLCQMPPPQMAESGTDVALVEATKKALALTTNVAGLRLVLEQECWNGFEFAGQVNRKRLAESLQRLMDLSVEAQ